MLSFGFQNSTGFIGHKLCNSLFLLLLHRRSENTVFETIRTHKDGAKTPIKDHNLLNFWIEIMIHTRVVHCTLYSHNNLMCIYKVSTVTLCAHNFVLFSLLLLSWSKFVDFRICLSVFTSFVMLCFVLFYFNCSSIH